MLNHFDREDLNQLWTLVKETLCIRQATSDKEKELRVELKRLYEPDVKDQLWTHNQALMHDPVEWRLYDTYDVHHGRIVGNKILKAFPLPVMSSYYQKTFPLLVKKGSSLISQKDATAEEVCTADEVKGRIVGNKIVKAFPLPVMSSYCQKTFPLLVKKVPLAEVKRSNC
nr:hypothetical protein [Tanacetum cinerariifolium]